MEEMEPMSEDEQSEAVDELSVDALDTLLHPTTLSSGPNAPWSSSEAPVPLPPTFDVLGAPSDYTYDPAGFNVFQSNPAPTLEMLSDDAQPAVPDYNRVQDVCEFIDKWSMCFAAPGTAPGVAEASHARAWSRPTFVKPSHLQGDRYDVQGINWTRLNVTRAQARRARALFYQKHASRAFYHGQWSKALPSSESYFRFCRMNTAVRPFISHFQLRNLITSTSQADIYYAGRFRVVHTDGHRVRSVMDLTPSSSTWQSRHLQITCLDSSQDLLVVGGFTGEYAIAHTGSETTSKLVHGFLTHEQNGITNHVHTFNHRHSRQTQAAFCSNDKFLRLLDCHSNTITDSFEFPFPVNCSATSPDGRLRMVVGDRHGCVLTNSETGHTLEQMVHHHDDIFACAWADDGIHVATGAQDSKVVVYDARRWDRPLTVLSTELACARSLRFSPVGSGKRLLYVAEASDFVTVVDAQSFEKCQTLDFFGSIGGIALSPDGSTLHVANCDPKFGGLMQYEQMPAYGYSSIEGLADDARRRHRGRAAVSDEPLDWAEEAHLEARSGSGSTWEHRFRKDLGLGDLMI